MAREVLGYDYDKDEKTGREKRPGGIRKSGPHKEMVAFLDSTSRMKHLEMPRGGYKTTGVQAYCIRKVTQDPNKRVLYGMETYSNALLSLDAMKAHFESNEKFIETQARLQIKGRKIAQR